MFILGMKINLIVDDYIPCDEYGKTIFSSANGSELWVILVEKAFAKMFKNYENIIAGDPTEALRILTGAPSETYVHKQSPNVFDQILEGEKMNFVMAACTFPASMVE